MIIEIYFIGYPIFCLQRRKIILQLINVSFAQTFKPLRLYGFARNYLMQNRRAANKNVN